jgi:hypothetical protein
LREESFMGSTWAGSCLAHKYYTRMEVTNKTGSLTLERILKKLHSGKSQPCPQILYYGGSL